MTKNTLLNIGIVICKFLRIFYIAFFIILLGAFVHYQISPSSYKDFPLDTKINSNVINSGFSFGVSKSYIMTIGNNVKMPKNSEVLTFNNLKYSSLYINFIKLSAIWLLIFLCITEFQKVIESVKGIKTFQKRNVSSFRRIGKYLLIIFILVSYFSFKFQQGEISGGISGYYISTNLLIMILLAFIMAEIFKEGNKLSEENELTV